MYAALGAGEGVSVFGIENYLGFVVAAVLLNMTPGSDTIYILTRSIAEGRKSGVASALGINTGVLVHTVLVSVGLSAVLMGSAVAFNALKIAGAAYLVVMGVRAIASKQPLVDVDGSSEKVGSLGKVYRQGVLTNALNPKVALFFLALLPQFVSAGNAFGPLPFLLLGLTFFCTSTVWSLILVAASSAASGFLRTNAAFKKWSSKVSGVIYVVLGLGVLAAKADA